MRARWNSLIHVLSHSPPHFESQPARANHGRLRVWSTRLGSTIFFMWEGVPSTRYRVCVWDELPGARHALIAKHRELPKDPIPVDIHDIYGAPNEFTLRCSGVVVNINRVLLNCQIYMYGW